MSALCLACTSAHKLFTGGKPNSDGALERGRDAKRKGSLGIPFTQVLATPLYKLPQHFAPASQANSILPGGRSGHSKHKAANGEPPRDCIE